MKGQENIKRAFEIAAAGGHNAYPHRTARRGKTMIAKRLPTIPPPRTSMRRSRPRRSSVAGKLRKDDALLSVRPFRSPHHTISDVAPVGGGSFPQPGESALAHNGVLFLDELPEFQRTVLEVMRQPLRISIACGHHQPRSSPWSIRQLHAGGGDEPCPCGY